MTNSEQKQSTKWSIGIALILGLGIGWCMAPSSVEPNHTVQSTASETVWTCSMHPQIQQPEFGDCPLCGMDLIPLEEGGEQGDGHIHLSERALTLASVETAVIQSEPIIQEISVRGRVDISEETEFAQTSHVTGRIEQLLVTHNGQVVNKGDVVAKVYSPDLITAQEELLEASKMASTNPGLLRAAKAKMRNWKLSDRQIDNILQRGAVIEETSVMADVSGTVMKLKVAQGDHLMVGQPLYQLADLSTAWVLFDIYESDLPLVKEGLIVQFQTRSNPNQQYTGTIQFIDPVLNSKTRTAQARVLFDNSDNNLRTGEWVTGQISVHTGEGTALQVPQSAVLWTGKRSVVYVRSSAKDVGVGESFEMREITLGDRLKETYIVESGLVEGDEVVVEGAFAVDSAVQLQGKKSMMREIEPWIETPTSTEPIVLSSKALRGMKRILSGYLSLKDALVEDDLERAKRETLVLKGRVEKVESSDFEPSAQQDWLAWQQQWVAILDRMESASDVETLRSEFVQLSNQWVYWLRRVGTFEQTLYLEYCPMADNNQGAIWVSTSNEIANPYFGASMLRCGEVQETLSPD